MTLLVDAFREHASPIDEAIYPADIYYDLLDRAREAALPEELGGALAHLIAWQDGKVRRDAKGVRPAEGHRSYRVERSRPTPLGARHEGQSGIWALGRSIAGKAVEPGSHFDRWRKQGFWKREERG